MGNGGAGSAGERKRERMKWGAKIDRMNDRWKVEGRERESESDGERKREKERVSE